jgi:ribA/ribD-fused uncharacterized protein
MSKNGIHPFWGGPFSQWARCKFTIDGIEYNCAEQYMMAAKAKLFNDQEALEAIMKSKDPREQKATGRKVKNFNPEQWEAIAKDVVTRANMAKFTQNEEMKLFMLGTGDDHIVEASPYDRIWGVGIAEDDERIWDKDQWDGKNWLGECLMEVREALKKA